MILFPRLLKDSLARKDRRLETRKLEQNAQICADYVGSLPDFGG